MLLTSDYIGTALDEQGVPADLPLLSKPHQRQELATQMRLVLGCA